MLLFALGPLVEFSLSPGEKELALCLVAYFATAWCTYLYVFVFKDASLKFGVAAAAFSLFIGYPIDLLLAHVPPFTWFYHLLSVPAGPQRFVGYVIGVGLEEELIKAIPVILLGFAFGRVKKPIDAIFFGVFSGFGFAINESSKYIVGMHNPAGILGQTLLRCATMPFLHGAWTAISGYFIAVAVAKRKPRAAFGACGIALAALVHGCFDGAPDGLPTVVAGLLAFSLFAAYTARAEDLGSDSTLREQETQANEILAAGSAREVAAGAGGTVQ
jgi:RsiW-degrading membrane proteinase PrsW (M82 family)